MLGRWENFHEKLLVSCWQIQKKEFRNGRSNKKEIFQKTASEFNSLQGRDGDRRTVRETDCKRGFMAGKPFHLTRNVCGISNRNFCLNGKRPCCPIDCFI